MKPSPLDRHIPPRRVGPPVNITKMEKLCSLIMKEVMEEHYPETQELLEKSSRAKGGSHAQ